MSEVSATKPFRRIAARGITTGERYKRQNKFQELYAALIPDNPGLARVLADRDEQEIFAMSGPSTGATTSAGRRAWARSRGRSRPLRARSAVAGSAVQSQFRAVASRSTSSPSAA